jgi:hypothetical protein
MKINNKVIITLLALLFSFNASAHLLEYRLDLETIDVEGPAFGGISAGDLYLGSLEIDTHVLQDIVDTDGGFATVFVPLQDEDDNFNLSYSINIGNYTYTEQTAGSFDSVFIVDDPANVEDVVNFTFEIGDSVSFNDFEITGGTTGNWFATDGTTGNVVSGTLTVSAVPVPATVWMFGSSLFCLAGLKRNNKVR